MTAPLNTIWTITKDDIGEVSCTIRADMGGKVAPKVRVCVADHGRNESETIALTADEADAMAEQLTIAARWVRLAESERAKMEATP